MDAKTCRVKEEVQVFQKVCTLSDNLKSKNVVAR